LRLLKNSTFTLYAADTGDPVDLWVYLSILSHEDDRMEPVTDSKLL
jgi:hypothetical protein